MGQAERILTRWFEAFDRDDMDAARRLWAANGVLHATNPPEIAGDVRGFDEFLTWYARKRASTGTDFRFTVHALVGDDVHAVALIHAEADRGLETVRLKQVCIYHVQDGRITEMWVHEEPE